MGKNKTSESNNIFWFYKLPLWLRVVLCIFLFPIFIPILVWPKLTIPMWGKITILVIWVIVILGISGSTSNSESNTVIFSNIAGVYEDEIKKDDKLSLKIVTEPLTVDEVTVNGEAVTKDFLDTEYSFEKTFPEGENTILVVAKNGGSITEETFNFTVDLSERKQLEEAKRIAEDQALVDQQEEERRKEKISDVRVVFDNLNMYIENKTSYDISASRIAVNCDIFDTGRCDYYKIYAPQIKLPPEEIVTISLNNFVDEETGAVRLNPLDVYVYNYEINLYSSDVDGEEVFLRQYNNATYIQ
jgi:hypothetical protein